MLHMASRNQQLKMATYFEEILGDMLLKVKFLKTSFAIFIVSFESRRIDKTGSISFLYSRNPPIKMAL